MRANRPSFPGLRHTGWKKFRTFSRRQDEAGAEIIEFALVMMAFSLVFFGVMAFGQALYAYHYVSDAARDGARFAIVRGSACTTWATACPAANSDVRNYVVSITPPGINTSASHLTVTTTWPGNGAGTCTINNSPGCPVKVQVQYKFTFPLVLPSAVTMTSASQMVISQ